MGRVIDLTIEGAHSLGERWRERALGSTTEEALKKLVDIISVSENNEGYTPNNLFIDGRRGSGKTTVLLTIKEILSNISRYGDIPDELKSVHFEVIDDVLDTSVNTMSVTFYFLGWLKERIEKEYECEKELKELLYEVINRFPSYLKKCKDSCSDIEEENDLAERLDRSDLKFMRKFHCLIDKYCRIAEKKSRKTFLVFFLDDLDISFPPERLQRILTEIYMFLSHPRIIVIAAGNYANLIDTVKEWVKRQESSEKEKINKEIAKSFLEKTFAVHAVHIPESSYELVKNVLEVKGNLNGKEFRVKVGEFLEALPIVRLLSFDSLPFKVLFNGLTIRELVLILKEVFRKIKEYCEFKDGKFVIKEDVLNSRVIDVCFTDIYQKVMKMQVVMSYDDRYTFNVGEVGKASEVDTLMYRIKEAIESGELPPIFYEEKSQSLLPLVLGIEGKRKVGALFWIWFNENLLFMDGLLTNLPRLLFLELLWKRFLFLTKDVVRKKSEREIIKGFLISFYEMWKNLNFDLDALAKDYFELYEFQVKEEKNLRVYLEEWHLKGKFSPLNFDRVMLVKAGQKFLSLERLLSFFSETKIPVARVVLSSLVGQTQSANYGFLELEKFLGNFGDKFLNYIRKLSSASSIVKLAFFEVLYLNLWYRLLYLPRIRVWGIPKDAFHKKQVEDVEEREKELQWLYYIEEEIGELRKVIECEEEKVRISEVKPLFVDMSDLASSTPIKSNS